MKMSSLSLMEADDRLSQGVVVAVSSGADRGHRPLLGQTLGVDNGEVLHPPVAVVDQAVEVFVSRPDAISKASRARLVRRVEATRHPTMRRLKTSMTKAA